MAKKLIYCDPADFCGYHGCGKINPAGKWKERRVCSWDDLLVCPNCNKAGTGKEIDEYNYWTIKDKGQREIAKEILNPII